LIYTARVILFALLLSLTAGMHAQALPTSGGSYGLAEGDIPLGEVGFNYNYIHANAPPGQCGCFSLNGGSATFVFNLKPQWAAMADITVAHSNNVNDTGQDITLIHYLFGMRYTKRDHTRYVPYAQALFGGAKEDVNFQFDINRNAFGLLGGGGVTTRLRDHLGWTIGEVDWVYTQVPNGENDRQNDLRVSTGLIYRF
jgi:outer membrane immunogenic protein